MNKLRQTDENFRTIFENANDGFLIAGVSDRKFVEANRNMCRMLGYTLDEIRTMGVEDIHPKQDLDHVLAVFEQQMRGEITIAEALPVLRKDGSVFYADVSSAKIILDDEAYALGIFRDITESEFAREDARRSERLFRSLFEKAPIGLAVVGLDERLLRVNQSLCDFLGYSKEELLTKTVSELTYPEDLELEARNKSEMEDGNEGSFQMEKRYIRSDGKVVWGQLSVSPLKDDTGETKYFLGTAGRYQRKKTDRRRLKGI